MDIQLRPYQLRASDDILAFFDASKPALAEVPCGGGKSFIIADVATQWISDNPDSRVLVLAHTKELVRQNFDAFRRFSPSIRASTFCAGLSGANDLTGRVVFASMQSLNSAAQLPRFDVMLIDEVHHLDMSRDNAVYTRLINRINPMHLAGLTATPWRANCGYIGDKPPFNQIAHITTYGELLAAGQLVPMSFRSAAAEIDMSGIKRGISDYETRAMAERVENFDTIKRAIVEAIPRLVDRRSIIVFCATRVQANHAASLLEAAGEAVATVDQSTPANARDEALKSFREGNLRWLVSVNVALEGYDAPGADALVVLRPTLSLALHFQMLGRGSRLSAGKTDCLVLDFTNNAIKHGLMDCANFERPGLAKIGSGGAAEKDRPWQCACRIINSNKELVCKCGKPRPEARRLTLNARPAIIGSALEIRFQSKAKRPWLTTAPIDLTEARFAFGAEDVAGRWVYYQDGQRIALHDDFRQTNQLTPRPTSADFLELQIKMRLLDSPHNEVFTLLLTNKTSAQAVINMPWDTLAEGSQFIVQLGSRFNETHKYHTIKMLVQGQVAAETATAAA